MKAPVAERDLLAEAARAVHDTPWPKLQNVSFLTKLTGGGDDVSRMDAVTEYVGALPDDGDRFERLLTDARQDLSEAERFNLIALHAMGAPRLAMNDVATVERAIQTVRAHRQIFTAAAKEIEKLGEPVEKDQVEIIRAAYSHSLKSLSETADLLADRIDRDRSATMAKQPGLPAVRNFSDL